MAISCVYCGGQHERPTQVRDCWNAHGGDDATAAEPSAPAVAVPTGPSPTQPSAPSGAVAGAGPDALGRHAIVEPGSAVPSEWEGARRLDLADALLDDPTALLATLRDAAIGSERLVIAIDPDLSQLANVDAAPVETTDSAPEQLGATFAFRGDELHHLIWSNSVDLRRGGQWALLDRAIAGGCEPLGPDSVGDVALADGTPMWLDGGPLRFHDPIDGVAVVHAVSIERASPAPPASNHCTADLAPDQLAAVTHAGGAARIIAPAGSGKTRVLTERARHLLSNWRLPATAVSLVAFNKRAQEQMSERTPDLPGLQVRTLNSLALAIVNGTAPFAPQPRRWQTIDEPEVRRLIGDLVSFPRRRNSDPVASWIDALSLVRLGLVDPNEVEARYDGDVDGFAAFWPQYRDALEQRGAVDFDDQIYRALLVLLRDPEARRAAQRACRTMLVDEFQDLTPAHVLMIRLLSAPGGAVFGVGDDDQTIYGYSGADPDWLINFAELFPAAGSHPLEVNYRCPAGIVDIADRLLRHNRRRVDKTIRAHSEDQDGWVVDPSPDPVAASRAAVELALADGAEPAEVAVLARVNAVLAPVQAALVAAGVPIAGGVGLEFCERTAVRSMLAWLRLACGGDGARFSSADLVEALRRPSRSFHPRITDWISEQRNGDELLGLAGRLNNDRDSDRLREFAADIVRLQHMAERGGSTSELIDVLISEIGLGGAVVGLDAKRRGMNRSAQGDDLTAVRHLAALHDDAASFERWLRGALAVRRSTDGVLLSTVHRVKGQEWPHVVAHLVGAEQYPHRLADDVEEERRLFHVAITRASRRVTVVAGADPSPFIEELTSEPSPDDEVVSHQPAPPSPNAAAGKSDAVADLDPVAAARFESLRALRYELAEGKPAYVVFDNKTLAAIARTAPSTTEEMSRIAGVGPVKLERYGDAFIDLLTELA